MSTQQIGQALPFQAFYTSGKTGKTGLTVTATVYNPAGTVVVTAAACTEIGNGLYAYTLASGSVATAGEYICIFHTADTTVNQMDMAANWEVGATWAQNLDAAVTTRATPTNITAGTITSIANDVGITQAGADKVWGSTSRTLSSTGTLVADTAAAVATAVWAAGSRTLTAFSFTVPATIADKTGYVLSTAGVQAVWDALLSALTTTGSIGKKLADWTVNADTGGTTTLLSRLTASRAGYLDNFTNALPTAAENAAQTRIELATELARIDVATSTRNATAPDNTGIAANGVLLIAVKAKTDNMPASPAATGAAMTLTSAYDPAKTAATQASVTAVQVTVDAIHAHANVDPLASVLPGDYAENTAGALIAKFITPDPSTPLSPIPVAPTSMEKCRVYGYFSTPDNKIPTGVNVVFELITPAGIKAERIIQGRKVTAIIVAGTLSSGEDPWVELDRNDLLIPSDSHWSITCASIGFNGTIMVLTTPLFDLSSLILE
jgi:hypothetical protein